MDLKSNGLTDTGADGTETAEFFFADAVQTLDDLLAAVKQLQQRCRKHTGQRRSPAPFVAAERSVIDPMSRFLMGFAAVSFFMLSAIHSFALSV